MGICRTGLKIWRKAAEAQHPYRFLGADQTATGLACSTLVGVGQCLLLPSLSPREILRWVERLKSGTSAGLISADGVGSWKVQDTLDTTALRYVYT